jgi:hypothetical protein
MEHNDTNPKRGYIHVEPQLGEYRHGDGLLGTVPLVSGGQWDSFLPEQHQQNENGFEPSDCVTEATINCIETLEMQEYGTNAGWARRYLAKTSGTDFRQGNDPQTVSECLRTRGTALERDYPFKVPDFNTFYQTLPDWVKVLAVAIFAKFSYGHSWVNANQQSMMDALEYSPLSAAGYAWVQDPQTGYYITPPNTTPEHDFMVYGYVRNNYWKVRDSYAPFEKKLAWDFKFTGIKRHTLHRQAANTPTQQTAWDKFVALIYQIVDSMQRKLGLGDYARNFGSVRSPQWGQKRADYLKKHPNCEACGGKVKCTVHHIHPVHLFPQYELLEMLEDGTRNYINLCEGNKQLNCHLILGHADNFRNKWNPNVTSDASVMFMRLTAKTEEIAFPLITLCHN